MPYDSPPVYWLSQLAAVQVADSGSRHGISEGTGHQPRDAATYYKLADAYSRIQKYDDAERLLQRSVRLDATSSGPYILMGRVLEKKGEFELAVRALQRATAMDPNNPTTHHLLGQAYRDMGKKKEEAENELKLAEQLQTKADSRP